MQKTLAKPTNYSRYSALQIKYIHYTNITKPVKKIHLARQLDNDKSIAIVCDAGTPLIADPDCLILSYLREKEYPTYVVLGCCSAIVAISVSGLPSDKFQFAGFVPSKSKQRYDFLQTLLYSQQTTVFLKHLIALLDVLTTALIFLAGHVKF